ncbi:tail fiber domain-containing protein [Pantoea ananatis]|nr:tail fiber domain-containing protein [Pantoea ananatis]
MAWYRTGTVQLTKGSTTVTGNGTNFTDSAAGVNLGDMLMAGGAFMEVAGVNSDTTLTLAVPSEVTVPPGSSFTIVTSFQMSNSSLSKKVSAAMDRILQNIANWMTLLTQTGNVTITPYGSDASYSGRSWREMNTQIDNNATNIGTKLAKSSNLADLPNIPAARDNIGVGYGTSAGTVAQGNDARLNTVDGKSGGTISGSLTTSGPITGPATGGLAVGAGESNRVELNNVGSGGNTGTPVGWTVYRWYNELVQTGIRRSGDTSIQSYFMAMSNVGSCEFQRSGNASAPGSWVNGSDERHKTKIKTVSDPLPVVLSWRGTTYDKKDGVREVGLIAQDVEKSCPEAITKNGDRKFMDGTVIPDFKYLNIAGAAAAYHTEAIKTIFEILYQLAESPDEALKTLEIIRKKAEEIKNISIEQEPPRKEKPPVFDVPTNEEPVNNEETGA